MTTRTLAVFGAGPALGLSTARRFAGEGYQVALVARNQARLDQMVAELRAGGVTVTSAVADLSDVAQVRAAAAAVVDQLGIPDVVLYAPGDVSRLPVGVLELSAETLADWLPLNLYSPIELTRAVLPGMLARGSGAILVAQGASARAPMPALASVAVAQAALLQYLNTLAAEVGPRGIRVRSLLIGALIERSAAAELWDDGHFDGIDASTLPRAHPDELAERYWTMADDDGDVVRSAP